MNNNYREDYQGYRDFLMHGFGGGGFVSKAIRRYKKRHAGGDDAKDNRVTDERNSAMAASKLGKTKSGRPSNKRNDALNARTSAGKIAKVVSQHFSDASDPVAKTFARYFGGIGSNAQFTMSNLNRLRMDADNQPNNTTLQQAAQLAENIFLQYGAMY